MGPFPRVQTPSNLFQGLQPLVPRKTLIPLSSPPPFQEQDLTKPHPLLTNSQYPLPF